MTTALNEAGRTHAALASVRSCPLGESCLLLRISSSLTSPVSRRRASRVGAGRVIHWIRFPTPPSEPDLHLSMHPALHLSVILRLARMTTLNAKCPKILWRICINGSFESMSRFDMVNLSRAVCYCPPAHLTDIVVPFQYQRT